MVEFLYYRFDHPFNLCKVHYPARFLSNLAGDCHAYTLTMTV